MKRIAWFAGLLVLAAPLSFAQATTWVSDQAHSEVDFSVSHLSISTVHGRFGKVNATVVYDQANIAKSSVKATIDINSVQTGEEGRDKHLKTADFFDAASFPAATFASTSVAKSGNGLVVRGNLTLHGITKPVTLTVEGPKGPVEGMDRKLHAGFEATTTISRTAFALGAKFPAAMVGDEIKLTIELDVAKQ
jgi:polyisoprenoid-binding protein YceI